MLKILLIEDDAAIRESLADYLPDHGLRVEVAETGEEGLQALENYHPDAVLCDVRLPGIDGFETCRRMKKADSTKNIPVIFVTARADAEDKIEGFGAGGVDYLTKPFQLEELVQRVGYHVGRRRLEEELRSSNQLLVLETERLNRLLSIVSHDFGNPLVGLQLFLSLMVSHPERRTEENLKTMLETVQSLQAMSESVLEWARNGPHNPERTLGYFELRTIVDTNLELVRTMAQTKGIQLDNQIDAEQQIYGDRNMIDTVVRNLLVNAIKFSHPGGEVLIGAEEGAQEVSFWVQDHGVGMGPEVPAKLFAGEGLYSTQGTNNEPGTGLGLKLCGHLVRANNGKISVESRPNEGALFRVSLPKLPS